MDFFKATDGAHWYLSRDEGETFTLCRRDPFPNHQPATPPGEASDSAPSTAPKIEKTLSREQLSQRGFTIGKVVCEAYSSHCSFEGNGNVLNEEDAIVWQLTTLHRRPQLFWFATYGIVRDPGCSIARADGEEQLLVMRERQFPLPRFVMTRGEERVCTISQRSPLFNTYSLELADGASWMFHMPLFQVHFQGVCDSGDTVHVREWSKRQWYLLFDAEHNDPLLICALAFIHRERLRFG